MSELRRMSDGDDLRAKLLCSAKSDIVPTGAKARAVASAVARAEALPARAAFATTIRAWLPKLFGLVLIGAGGVGIYSIVRAPEARLAVARPRAPRARVAWVVTAPPSETLPVLSSPAPRPAPVPARMAPQAASSAPSARLAEEVRRLERVRVALVAGEAARALTELAAYEREFPSAQLARDATLLKIQALDKSGQHERAEELARSLSEPPSRGQP